MKIPIPIVDFLAARSANSNSPCGQCNAACCSGPGFALLENVLEIYKRYVAGELTRSDFSFEAGLTLSKFVFKYFDRVTFNNSFLVFFPKTISETGGLNSVPPWNYFGAREYLKKRNTSLGCIFLAKQQRPSDDSHNYCILHNDRMNSEITEKPIDCAFLTCNGLKLLQAPSQLESNLWLSLLDYHFPSSIQRFYELCPDLIGQE